MPFNGAVRMHTKFLVIFFMGNNTIFNNNSGEVSIMIEQSLIFVTGGRCLSDLVLSP